MLTPSKVLHYELDKSVYVDLMFTTFAPHMKKFKPSEISPN